MASQFDSEQGSSASSRKTADSTPLSSSQDLPNPPEEQEKATTPEIEKLRLERAYHLSIIGFTLTIVLAMALAVMTFFGFDSADTVSQVISPFLTVLGTLVGTFFGIQVGSAGKETLMKEASEANMRASAFAAAIEPASMPDVIQTFEALSRG